MKLALLAAAALAASLLGGCGSGQHSRAGSQTETVVRTIAATELTQQHGLRTCVDLDSAPFAFTKAGRMTGFEVELLERIARRLGLRVVWVPTPRPGFAAALKARKCDVIVSRLGYDLDTQFHLKVGALQYMALPLALVVPLGSGTAPVAIDDLCGRDLVVVAWTAPDFDAREAQKTCRDEGRAPFRIVDVTGRKGYISLGYRSPGLSTETGVRAALLTLYEDGVVQRLVKRWHLDDATLLP